MQIRANHITLLRIVLLPLPCALLFHGTTARMGALGLFAVLAATDWYDGILARRQGPTVLGGLLDPIADKIFIAFAYFPLMCIEGESGSGLAVFPVWLVTLLFFREFYVTGLRTLAAMHRIEFQTSVFAKYKTAIQMEAIAVILWVVVWQRTGWIMLGGIALAALVLMVIVFAQRARVRPIGLVMRSMTGTFVGSLLLAAILPLRWCFLCIGLAVLSVTLISGAQYAVRVHGKLASADRPLGIGGMGLSVIESICPLAFIGLAAHAMVPIGLPIAIVMSEFATGGLGNLLATEGIRRRSWFLWLRGGVLLGLGVCAWLSAHLGWGSMLTMGVTICAFAISAAYTAWIFIAFRRVYLR
jgi:CDP-diacylglycerol--glycerol-3-phosphate 3-phosphatidyltransferase